MNCLTKPKLLYFSSDGLGENIFATPSLDFLSRYYDVNLIIKKHYSQFFAHYKFINIIPIQTISHWQDIVKNKSYFSQHINFDDYEYTTSHFERIVESLKRANLPVLNHLKENTLRLSCAENFLHQFGADVNLMDTSFRSIKPVILDNKQKIVLYMGSKETLRKLPVDTYNKILQHLNYNFSEKYYIHCIYDKKYQSSVLNYGIHHTISDTEDNVNDLLNLFSSGVNLMIGPDSGLTQVALAFKIPQVWLETRDRLESMIPRSLHSIIQVFRAKSPPCLQHCKARTHLKLYGPHIKQRATWSKEAVEFDLLPCKQEQESPCLKYNDTDLKSLINLISSLL